jgi:hypothetical protein
MNERSGLGRGRPQALALAALEGLTGIAALGAAAHALGGAHAVPTAWLEGSPFRSYAATSSSCGTAA